MDPAITPAKKVTFLAMAEPHNLALQLPVPLVLSQYYELRVLFPYPRLIPIFAGDNCQMCPCYIMLSCLNQACFLKNDPLLWCRTFPHAVVPVGSGAWNSHLRIHGPWARQWGSPSSKSTGPSMFPSFLPLVPWCRIFFHDVPYIESKSEILCYMFFPHITSLQKDLNLSPPQTIRNCKGLRMVVLCYSCSTVPSYCIITEGSKSATPSKQYI